MKHRNWFYRLRVKMCKSSDAVEIKTPHACDDSDACDESDACDKSDACDGLLCVFIYNSFYMALLIDAMQITTF